MSQENAPAPRIRPCRFFRRGDCRDGDDCKFSHAPREPRPEGGERPPARCRFFAKGECKEGNECKFLHTAAPAKIRNRRRRPRGEGEAAAAGPVATSEGANRTDAPKKCRFFNSVNGCKLGDECPFAHVPREAGSAPARRRRSTRRPRRSSNNNDIAEGGGAAGGAPADRPPRQPRAKAPRRPRKPRPTAALAGAVVYSPQKKQFLLVARSASEVYTQIIVQTSIIRDETGIVNRLRTATSKELQDIQAIDTPEKYNALRERMLGPKREKWPQTKHDAAREAWTKWEGAIKAAARDILEKRKDASSEEAAKVPHLDRPEYGFIKGFVDNDEDPKVTVTRELAASTGLKVVASEKEGPGILILDKAPIVKQLATSRDSITGTFFLAKLVGNATLPQPQPREHESVLEFHSFEESLKLFPPKHSEKTDILTDAQPQF